MSDLSDRGGICLCGAVRWSVVFGGKLPAHFTCDVCRRMYDLDGNLMPDRTR